MSAEQTPSLPETRPEKMLGVSLTSPRQVMEAFLSGAKLQHREYGDSDGEMYLYLDPESGHFCEEDGAGAKEHRLPISFRDGDPEWRIIGFITKDVA